MFSTYILGLEDARFYVGMAPTKRLDIRIREHFNKTHPGAKWTQKYKPLKVVTTQNYSTKKECEQAENRLTRQYMERHGLDSVRGGQWVMTSEGPSQQWWVPPELKGYPRLISERRISVC